LQHPTRGYSGTTESRTLQVCLFLLLLFGLTSHAGVRANAQQGLTEGPFASGWAASHAIFIPMVEVGVPENGDDFVLAHQLL
jgi:hypothetical protein